METELNKFVTFRDLCEQYGTETDKKKILIYPSKINDKFEIMSCGPMGISINDNNFYLNPYSLEQYLKEEENRNSRGISEHERFIELINTPIKTDSFYLDDLPLKFSLEYRQSLQQIYETLLEEIYPKPLKCRKISISRKFSQIERCQFLDYAKQNISPQELIKKQKLGNNKKLDSKFKIINSKYDELLKNLNFWYWCQIEEVTNSKELKIMYDNLDYNLKEEFKNRKI